VPHDGPLTDPDFPPTVGPKTDPDASIASGDDAPPPTVPPTVGDGKSPPTLGGAAAPVAHGVPLFEGPASALVPGYEVLGVLGRGGMGVVYKARHLKLNRVVALKMILHAGHAGPGEHFRFLREAEAIAAIRHPGVVQVYDFGTHDGAPYFALEFCAGGTLAHKLSGKPLPPREAADLVEQVARAVQAAHKAGIVHSADPTRRSYLVWWASERGADPRPLLERLGEEKDDSARRALIVALGGYDDERLPQNVREPLVKKLLAWYRDDPDPGVHAAIGWLLGHKSEGPTPRPLDWGQSEALAKIDEELAGKKQRTKPTSLSPPPPVAEGYRGGEGWYVNGQGQTMVMIRGPLEFRMGSPRWEPERISHETWHLRRVPRSYSIGSTSVTVGQWERFLKDRPDARHAYVKRHSPDDGCPIIFLTWYVAAQYCNWLSEKEGIPEAQWCYPRNVGHGMKPFPDHLDRTGYRLPTEAEMEHACKAGAQESTYSFGSSIELLPRYCYFQTNSKGRTWPVGSKRPNDLGLFDTHGNVWNWCDGRATPYPQRRSSLAAIDSGDSQTVDATFSRALRGSGFSDGTIGTRSAHRGDNLPSNRYANFGLRVCRTLPPDSFTTAPPP
jgi:formylglycine-generating enzyme required for sulfatase activity